MHNYGTVPVTVSHVAIDLPASFHQTAVGLAVTSDANDIGDSGISLLDAYTMPPESTVYMVVLGTVTCPATDLDLDPRVHLTVGDTRLSFDALTGANGVWEADVAKYACK